MLPVQFRQGVHADLLVMTVENKQYTVKKNAGKLLSKKSACEILTDGSSGA